MKFLSSALFGLLATACVAQTTHELTNVGTTFSPTLINAVQGDEIHLVLNSIHTFTEVSEATWNANGNTPNGGFNFSAGENTFTLDEVGTIYYVCSPHAGMGMKGRIIVSTSTSVDESTMASPLRLYPNPANYSVKLNYASNAKPARIEVMNVQGQVALVALPTADGLLDVSSLMTGNYTVLVTNVEGSVVMRERLAIAR